MSVLTVVFWVFVTTALLTGVIRSIALRMALLDLPVARSAHSQPTPVGGGLGIVLLYLACAALFFSREYLSLSEGMAVLGAVVIAILGFIDDRSHLDVKWRLPLQVLAALWAVLWLGEVPAIAFGSWIFPSSWLLNVLAVLALVWLTNLYNFMDGIDGIAGSELVFVNAMTLLFVVNTQDQALGLLSASLMAAGAGFLLWNWPPARIFMGDVGSGFIGFSFGVLALISMHHGSMSVWTWVLLLGVFIADATVTLVRRLVQGAKWYEGHSSHAYQNAARKYKSHAKVTITIVIINVLWLAPLAWVTLLRPELGLALSVLGIVPLVVLAIRTQAGKPATAESVIQTPKQNAV